MKSRAALSLSRLYRPREEKCLEALLSSLDLDKNEKNERVTFCDITDSVGGGWKSGSKMATSRYSVNPRGITTPKPGLTLPVGSVEGFFCDGEAVCARKKPCVKRAGR